VNEWRSQQGRDRAENRDAGGIHIGSNQTVAVVVDAAERGLRGVDYAIGWVRQLLEAAQTDGALTPDGFVQAMRRAHGAQRDAGFLHEVAAYAVLVIDSEKHSSWALSCGDCRIGVLAEEGVVTWLTPVHTGANPLGQPFMIEHARMDARHLLTRRLRVKRFDEPALTMLSDVQARSWLLATDGYWVNRLESPNQEGKPEDDASVLIFTPPCRKIEQKIDCINFCTNIAATIEASGI